MITTEVLPQIYTAKAKLDDAKTAMKGDVVRGVIELVTNSNDAYERSSI